MIRRVLVLGLVVGLIGSFTGPVVAGSLDDDLRDVRRTVLEIKEKMDDSTAEHSVVSADLRHAIERLDDVEREVEATGARLTRTARDHQDRTVDLEAVRAVLAERLVALFEIRDQRDEALKDAEGAVVQAYMAGGAIQQAIAFSASAVVDVSVGVAYIDVLTSHRSEAARRFTEIVTVEEAEERLVRAAEEEIVRDIRTLEASAERLDAVKEDLAGQHIDLVREYELHAALLGEVEAEISNFEVVLAGLEREESTIRAKIRAASQPEGTRPGKLVRPVPGAISSGFGMRMHPIFGNLRMHNGIDMFASHGSPIRAAGDGTVIWSGVRGGFGNTIMIDHGGGMVTLYAHQSRLGASLGERVMAGETIGYIGTTGVSTGPHLHFEVRINGVPVDPVSYL